LHCYLNLKIAIPQFSHFCIHVGALSIWISGHLVQCEIITICVKKIHWNCIFLIFWLYWILIPSKLNHCTLSIHAIWPIEPTGHKKKNMGQYNDTVQWDSTMVQHNQSTWYIIKNWNIQHIDICTFIHTMFIQSPKIQITHRNVW